MEEHKYAIELLALASSNNLAAGLIVAFAAPLIITFFNFFTNEAIRKKINDIKLLAEVDALTGGNRTEHYNQQLRDEIDSSRYFSKISSEKGHVTSRPMSFAELLFSLFIPVSLAILAILKPGIQSAVMFLASTLAIFSTIHISRISMKHLPDNYWRFLILIAISFFIFSFTLWISAYIAGFDETFAPKQ
jgi:hypothetical protein